MTDSADTVETPSPSQGSLTLLFLAYGLLFAGLVVILGPAITGHERLAYRDVSHFYTPLYEYVAARQSESWLPLWNPMDLTGLPLAGETTTAVYYPIRILVYAIAPSPTTAIAWYVVLHLLLAAVAIHVAAGSAGASRLGCSLAILVYPLAGPIFFLIYNPAFLVGAAWMPIAIAGGLQGLQRTSLRWIAITAIALAMPVLGGEPQTTVHVMMLGAAVILARIVSRFRDGTKRFSFPLVGLFASLGLSGCLAAPQLAASIDWGLHSSRVIGDFSNQTYNFSTAPWRWFELFIPAASGRLFPINTRLEQLIPGSDRAWVASLYLGIIPLLLVIDRCLSRRLRDLDIWEWMVPIGLIFSMAGPYWILATFVPGYGAFRYPSKWLPVVTVGMAVMSARQFESWSVVSHLRMRLICVSMVMFAVVVAAAMSLLGSATEVSEGLQSLQLTDRFWGPLRTDLAFDLIAWSALVTAMIASIFWVLINSSIPRNRSTICGCILIAIVSADLFRAVESQLAMVHVQREDQILAWLADDHDNENAMQARRSLRTSGVPPWPEQWREEHDGKQRILEVEVSQRATRFGRWHLSTSKATFNSLVSIQPQRIDAFWDAIAIEKRFKVAGLQTDAWSRVEHWLGIDHQWTSSVASVPGFSEHDLVVLRGREVKNPISTSLYRWDEQWRPMAPQNTVSTKDMSKRLAEVIENQAFSNPLVEGGSQPPERIAGPQAQVQSVVIEDDRIEFQIDTTRLGLLTVKTFQDGNWRGQLTELETGVTQAVIVRPTDYLFMGVEVPAGKWRVTLWNWPWWMAPSLAIAAMGYVLAAIGLIVRTTDQAPVA